MKLMIKLTSQGTLTPRNPSTATGPISASTLFSSSFRGISLLGPPPVADAFLLESAALPFVLALNSIPVLDRNKIKSFYNFVRKKCLH